MGGGYIVVINAAGVAVGPVFVLGTAQIAVFCGCTAVGAGLGISTLRTGITAEGVIAPSGIPVAFQFLTTAIAFGVITVHIAVFVGIHRFRVAVLTVTAGSTFAIGIECVIQPTGITVAFRNGTALRTLGNIAVHVGVFTGIHLRVAMGARSRYRQRQDGHDHHDRQDQTQDFTEFLFQGSFSFPGVAKKKTPQAN